jgi:protease IV
MNPRTLLTSAFCLLSIALTTGCGQQTGWLIKPVPLDESLRETVLTADSGWFIRDKIVIIDVDGLLMNVRERGFWGTQDNPVSLFVEKLQKASSDPAVRAVVLRVNSPGGGVTASDIMYKHLMDFRREKSVPVIAVIEDVGASGAYYVACGANHIVVHPTSVVGSIGVIMQTLSLSRTMKMIGIEAKAITSGPFKDLGSPLKPLDARDLAILQRMVDAYWERFLEVVETGRPGLSKGEVHELADGRIFTGTDSVEYGLADEVGYLDSALARAKQQAGLKRAQVVIYHRPLGYRANVYSTAPTPAQINLLNVSLPEVLQTAQPQFLYLWTGRTGGR